VELRLCVCRGVVSVGERQNDPMMTLLLLVSGFRREHEETREAGQLSASRKSHPIGRLYSQQPHTPRQIIANASLTS